MEQSYLELITKLHESVQSDISIPSDVKKKIEAALAALQDVLWRYSA